MNTVRFGQCFIAKILECRDPRCKHEYLDSPWDDDDGDESDKHI